MFSTWTNVTADLLNDGIGQRFFRQADGPVHRDRILAQCNGNHSSSNPLKVTILATQGRIELEAMVTRELAKQLAKLSHVKVTLLVPENSQYSEKDKRDTQNNYSYTILEAKKQPGFQDPIEWLNFPPAELNTDIVVGFGMKLGKIAQHWKERHHCKSIHIFSEKICHQDYIHSLLSDLRINFHFEETRKELCRITDLPVAFGPKTSDELSASLRSQQKEVFNLTPGIINEFSHLTHAASDGAKFRVLFIGGDNPDNFQKEGLDIAAKAVTELNDKSYHLIYVGAGEGTKEQFSKIFQQCGVAKRHLTIRSLPKDDEEWKRLFCEVDLAIMPSGEKEFGLEALLAVSAGLPVLVHGDSGFGEALKEVKFGTSAVVNSDDPVVWAEEIKMVKNTDRKQRLEQAAELRSYYHKMYSWEEQCGVLVRLMLEIVCASENQEAAS